MLRDEGEAFAAKLRQAKVPVTNVRYGGMIHDFVMLNALHASGSERAAVAQGVTVLKTALHGWARVGAAAHDGRKRQCSSMPTAQLVLRSTGTIHGAFLGFSLVTHQPPEPDADIILSEERFNKARRDLQDLALSFRSCRSWVCRARVSAR